MRNILIKKKLYRFDELSDEIKEKLKDRHIIHMEDNWYDYTIEYCTDVLKILGMDIDSISFSGFWSQGDGANWTGTYGYRKNNLKELIKKYPHEEEVIRIAKEINKYQRSVSYIAEAEISKNYSIRYSHERSVNIIVFNKNDHSKDVKLSGTLDDLFRDSMQWIYSKLEEEYEYRCSYDYIRETYIDDEFFANGDLFSEEFEHVVPDVKTMEQWADSKKSFLSFVEEGDEIDEKIMEHFLSCVPPLNYKNGFLCGEPYDHDENGNTKYIAFEKNNDKFYYVGLKEESK
jgi:hypothetical protein